MVTSILYVQQVLTYFLYGKLIYEIAKTSWTLGVGVSTVLVGTPVIISIGTGTEQTRQRGSENEFINRQ